MSEDQSRKRSFEEEEQPQGEQTPSKRLRPDGEQEGQGDGQGEPVNASSGSNLPLGPDGKPQTIELRFMIENFQVGSIIGKSGSNVKRIRQEAGVFISVLKLKHANRQVKDRVLTITGTPEKIGHSLEILSHIMIKANEEAESKGFLNRNEAGQMSAYRLLIHQANTGCIIGKQGTIIREIQQSSGARIKIDVDPLPMCTEKVVTLQGTPLQVRAAITRLATQLLLNPLRPNTHTVWFDPEAAFFAPDDRRGPPGPGRFDDYGPPGGYDDYAHRGPPRDAYGRDDRRRDDWGPPQGGYPPYGPPRGGYDPYAPPPPMSSEPPAGPPVPIGQGKVRQEMGIPSSVVGAVIGPKGTIIGRIKEQSQCHITIADVDPKNADKRIAIITGPASGIDTAVRLIREAVDRNLANQAARQGERGPGGPGGYDRAPPPSYGRPDAYPAPAGPPPSAPPPAGGYNPYAAPPPSSYAPPPPQPDYSQGGYAAPYGAAPASYGSGYAPPAAAPPASYAPAPTSYAPQATGYQYSAPPADYTTNAPPPGQGYGY